MRSLLQQRSVMFVIDGITNCQNIMAEDSQTGISMEAIEQAYVDRSNARNNLTVLQMNSENAEIGDGNNCAKHFVKVCCICDRLIRYDHEMLINITEFKKPVVKNSFHKEKIDGQREH